MAPVPGELCILPRHAVPTIVIAATLFTSEGGRGSARGVKLVSEELAPAVAPQPPAAPSSPASIPLSPVSRTCAQCEIEHSADGLMEQMCSSDFGEYVQAHSRLATTSLATLTSNTHSYPQTHTHKVAITQEYTTGPEKYSIMGRFLACPACRQSPVPS